MAGARSGSGSRMATLPVLSETTSRRPSRTDHAAGFPALRDAHEVGDPGAADEGERCGIHADEEGLRAADTGATAAHRAAHRQELLEEPADLAFAVDEVHLQDPVALPAAAVGAAHRAVAAGRDVALDALAVDQLVRELADEVAAVRAAERPARGLGQADDVGVQLRRP